ncbi:MAG: Trk system potassium transporter TrkA [Gammaproteobacteria bacterium]|nr:Trk system potassium transporter TrkA [Gammaproteobacteria bacterium]
MKILILSSDIVGQTLAANLVQEGYDVTVIDENEARLKDLGQRLDISTVCGQYAYPDVLKQAGAEQTQILLAVTTHDEVNMIACQVAFNLFHIPTKIARIRSQGFLVYPQIFSEKAIPIDILISPEQLVTNTVFRLIQYPGTLQILDFANGKVQLAVMRAYHNGLLVGHTVQTLKEHLPGIGTWIVAIYRRGQPIMPKARTVVEVNDEVFLLIPTEHTKRATLELRGSEKPYKHIMIAGGGNIGLRLAEALEHKCQVKIIEANAKRAHHISQELNTAIVLHGDAADETLLLDENIKEIDMFCSVTNDDEANILSALLAKRLGARKVIALINRTAYIQLIQGSAIDVALSPQQVTISGVLAYIRKGDVVKDYTLRHGVAEAIETVIHGDSRTSDVIGKKLKAIPLPPGTTIGAVVRGDKVFMGHQDITLQAEDHIVLFLIDKRYIHKVESLFQVRATPHS